MSAWRPAVLAAVFAALSAGCAGPVPAGPEWRISAADPSDLAGAIAEAAAYPNSARLERRILAMGHEAGDRPTVRRGLDRLADLGYAPSAETLDRLAVHLLPPEMAALRLRFDANRASVRSSRLFATIPAAHRLVEGIAWDARRQLFFAATVVGRELVVRDGNGWRTIPGLDAGSLFGLAVDATRGLLWASSGAVEQTPSPERAFRGLIAIDLDSLQVVRRLPAETGSPADIAVAADGSVYASDPVGGAIFRAAPGATRLAILVAPGRFRNPQGLVPASGGRLYVADYHYGLALVKDGRIERLESSATTMLDGIDGLVGYKGDLIAIQNGASPRRILRLGLGRGGRRIEQVTVLESAHPEWGEPTQGMIQGNAFVYVADAQWDVYGPGGAEREGRVQRPTAVRLVRLEDQ